MLEPGISAPLQTSADAALREMPSSDRLKWRSVACAVAAHSCIGGIYTFSLFVEPLARNIGVVGAAPRDWNVSAIIPIFSLTVTMAGLTAAFTGAWAERVGPRHPIMLAGLFWGGGLMLCAGALRAHVLWLVYLFYGLFGGFGVGLACEPTRVVMDGGRRN